MGTITYGVPGIALATVGTIANRLGSTEVLVALACVETNMNHFAKSSWGDPKGVVYPIENAIKHDDGTYDSDGGFGLMQLTNPKPKYYPVACRAHLRTYVLRQDKGPGA
ncbi:MAG: hypothetical protein HY894_05580 [Deltaproteobacteria bacterium]|nr:hypothetical protein [Deltaproteobacteria bacterium]